MPAPPTAVIMAAGRGTRMRSALPKVLHPVCGRPMLHWVIGAAREAGAADIVCVTRPGDGVAEALPDGVHHAEQDTGEGTAAAMLAAREHLERSGTVLVLSGDHPLIPADVISDLATAHEQAKAAATLLTTEELDPTGYGRVVRAADGSVERLVETKHPENVSADELAIREINLGTYAFSSQPLLEALDAVPEEHQGERYLTAVFPLLRASGHAVATHPTRDTDVAIGVNTRVGLMEVESLARARILQRHALAGVSFPNPATVTIDAGVEIGADTTIRPGVILTGATRIGSRADIGPHSTIASSRIGDEASVVHSHLTECTVDSRATIGPFSYLRPGAHVHEDAKVGAFCEVKNSEVGQGAKVPHLSYVGDAEVGAGANLGAGTITANYDGRSKHRTVVGERVRTGVHTSLVAPVSVGDEAYTGAGSVISEDVPAGALGIARPEQRNVEGYSERVKERER